MVVTAVQVGLEYSSTRRELEVSTPCPLIQKLSRSLVVKVSVQMASAVRSSLMEGEAIPKFPAVV